MIGMLYISRLRQLAFGFPVVPLEKLRNASFVLDSPLVSGLSTKLRSWLCPKTIKSFRFFWWAGEPEFESALKRAMWSSAIPAVWAAKSAVDKESGWTRISRAFVRVSWWTSSSEVYAGLAGLFNHLKISSIHPCVMLAQSPNDSAQPVNSPHRNRIIWNATCKTARRARVEIFTDVVWTEYTDYNHGEVSRNMIFT
jgi:hypothetical protein